MPQLGIDVARYTTDVRRLLFAHFHRKLAGLSEADIEDLIQGIFVKLIKAQQGKHPYDPSRAAVSTYLVRVIGSYLSNEHRSRSKRRKWEVTGLPDRDGEDSDAADADHLMAIQPDHETEQQVFCRIARRLRPGNWDAAEALIRASEGKDPFPSEWTPKRYKKARTELRRAAAF